MTLLQKTHGYSGSDVRLVCREAAMRPVRKIFDLLESPQQGRCARTHTHTHNYFVSLLNSWFLFFWIFIVRKIPGRPCDLSGDGDHGWCAGGPGPHQTLSRPPHGQVHSVAAGLSVGLNWLELQVRRSIDSRAASFLSETLNASQELDWDFFSPVAAQGTAANKKKEKQHGPKNLFHIGVRPKNKVTGWPLTWNTSVHLYGLEFFNCFIAQKSFLKSH